MPERCGEKPYKPIHGIPGSDGQPSTPVDVDVDALVAKLDTIAELGQRAMRLGGGITLPSGRKSTRSLRT